MQTLFLINLIKSASTISSNQIRNMNYEILVINNPHQSFKIGNFEYFAIWTNSFQQFKEYSHTITNTINKNMEILNLT